jgi:hypothetical protein
VIRAVGDSDTNIYDHDVNKKTPLIEVERMVGVVCDIVMLSREDLADLCLLHLLVFWNTENPIEEDSCRNIESNVYPEKTKVSPPSVPVCMNALQKLVGAIHLTVVTLASSLWIPKEATSHRDIVAHVPCARLILWCKERLKLGRIAVGRRLSKGRSHETGDQVRERIDMVHEDPKTW